jgi:hypothetical protein
MASSSQIKTKPSENPAIMCFRIGKSVVIPLAENLVAQLGIDSETAIFEQVLTDEGILLRARKSS